MQQAHAEMYDLLSHAFEGWGSDDYFRWKYPQYPGYDPAADNFTVTNESGEIVAARRVFRHRLRTPDGDTLSVHVHGGTAVHEAYRGRGYYTKLLEESVGMSRRKADTVVTFNRAGKITTKHHAKNGWNQLQLPVYVAIVSPSRLFAQYITDSTLLEEATALLSPLDRKLTASTAVSRSLSALAAGVYGCSHETPHTGGDSGTVTTTNSRLRADGDGIARCEYDIDRLDGPVSETVAAELHDRLQSVPSDRYRFDRSLERLTHCLRYPEATVFLARETGAAEILDFVVAGCLEKGGFTEWRVLEQTWANPGVTRRLFEAVESHARSRGADVIVACSGAQPGDHWLALGTEYMMWPPDDGPTLPTTADEWRVTAYDIL